MNAIDISSHTYEDNKRKIKLFDDTESYEQYQKHTFYTNQNLPVTQIWEQYKGCGDCENRSKKLKYVFVLKGFNLKKNCYRGRASFCKFSV